MGNSEVGHLNIGAGRVVYQDLVKINRACRDNSIMQNPEVKAAFEYAAENGVNVQIGYIETHGRAGTEALLQGLPVIPRRKIFYKGKELEEMDLGYDYPCPSGNCNCG